MLGDISMTQHLGQFCLPSTALCEPALRLLVWSSKMTKSFSERVSMFEEAPSLEPRKLFEACQRDLARSDPDTCPCLDQVRAYFLLVVGLGLAAGPYVAASLLSRACYLSQILDLVSVYSIIMSI